METKARCDAMQGSGTANAPHGVPDEGLVQAHLLGQAADHLVAQHRLRGVRLHEVSQGLADLEQLRLLQVHRRLQRVKDRATSQMETDGRACVPPSSSHTHTPYLGGDEGVVQQLLRRPALRGVFLQAPASIKKRRESDRIPPSRSAPQTTGRPTDSACFGVATHRATNSQKLAEKSSGGTSSSDPTTALLRFMRKRRRVFVRWREWMNQSLSQSQARESKGI